MNVNAAPASIRHSGYSFVIPGISFVIPGSTRNPGSFRAPRLDPGFRRDDEFGRVRHFPDQPLFSSRLPC
jgi:hypothetical protein